MFFVSAASHLLQCLLYYSSSDDRVEYVRCVYLHTMADNAPAISFYRRHGFRMHRLLRNYYMVDEKLVSASCCCPHCLLVVAVL